MARIPEETVDQVLAATDIVDLISSYFPVKRAGSTFKALCPFHNEKTPSFNINPARQTFKCFGCDEGGTAIGFVMRHENLSFPDAVRKLAQRASISIEEESFDPEVDKARRMRAQLIDLHKKSAEFMHRLLMKDPRAQHARDYLKSRGYGAEMAQRWLVGWMPENGRDFLHWAKEAGFDGWTLNGSGLAKLRDEHNPNSDLWVRFQNRLMFPIRNDFGDVIAFSGRQLVEDPKSGKYINSPETSLFKKSRVFFGLDTARRTMAKEHLAILCEGQLDVIACHEAGFTNAVAGLGTALTPEHARLLKRYTENVVICYDSDSAGFKASERAFREFAKFDLTTRVAALPEGHDPDTFLKAEGPEAFRELLTKAQGFLDYMVTHAKADGRFAQPNGRAEVSHQLAELTALIKDKVSKDTMINDLAGKLGVGAEQFRQAVVEAENRPQRDYTRQEKQTDAPARPTAADRSVLLLCQYALMSSEVLDWLCEQTESLLDSLEGREGAQLLLSILSKRPDPTDSAKINRFLSQLPAPDQAALLSALEEALPEDPLAAATATLGVMAHEAIVRQLDVKKAALTNSNLSEEEEDKLVQEVLDLRNLLKNSPDRFRS
jgi:DNA primase